MCRWCLHWPLYSSHVAFCVMRYNWPLNLPDDLQATCAANSSLPYYLHSLHLLKVSPFPSFFNPPFITHYLSSSGLNLYYHQATALSYLKSGHWYLFSKPFRRTRIVVDRLSLQKVCKEIRKNGLVPNHRLRRLSSSGIKSSLSASNLHEISVCLEYTLSNYLSISSSLSHQDCGLARNEHLNFAFPNNTFDSALDSLHILPFHSLFSPPPIPYLQLRGIYPL